MIPRKRSPDQDVIDSMKTMKKRSVPLFLTSMFMTLTFSAVTISAQEDEKDPEVSANEALENAPEEMKKAAWLTSIEDGVKLAKEQNKLVLIEFTGSDWCPPCIMMNEKVFGKTAFLEGAQKDYILVKLDMPNSDPELKKENELLMSKFKVRGVPSVLLFDADGKEFTRFIASQHRTVDAFLDKLVSAKRRKDMF